MTMLAPKWNSHQQHCLSLMGVDKLYFVKDNNLEHGTVEKIQTPQQLLSLTTTIQTSPQRINRNPAEQPTQTPVENLTPHHTLHPSVAATPTTPPNDGPNHPHEPPTPANAQANTAPIPAPTTSEQPQPHISKHLLVVGHQPTLNDLLLGKRLINDLCLYLTRQVKAPEYIRLSEQDDSQLTVLCQKILDDQPTPAHNKLAKVFYIIAQGEEQTQRISDFITNNAHFSPLLSDKKVHLLTPLTHLLSHPQAKQTLFENLQQG